MANFLIDNDKCIDADCLKQLQEFIVQHKDMMDDCILLMSYR